MSNIFDGSSRDGILDGPTDLPGQGAQQLIATPVEAKLEVFLTRYGNARSQAGHAAVARIAKLRSKTGKTVTVRSALVPP